MGETIWVRLAPLAAAVAKGAAETAAGVAAGRKGAGCGACGTTCGADVGTADVVHSPFGPRFTRSLKSPFSRSNSERPFLVISSMTSLISLRSIVERRLYGNYVKGHI